MNRLVALALPGGVGFVEQLRRIWDAGDAAFPLDLRLPPTARQRVVAEMAVSSLVDESGRHHLDGGRPVEPGDALVVATSGSTGTPKGVVLTHDAVIASASATSARIGLRPDDHWLACLPLAHIGGLSVVTRALASDTQLTVLPGFDADAVTAAATSGGATLVSLVPTALLRIDPSIFRAIVLGGSRPTADRPPHVLATYGLTESGSGVVYNGRPLDTVDVRIDAAGEIHLRGPMLLRAYRDGRDPKDGDGWLATGDLGSWLTDGRLHVEGRRGDLIITGGENVWPETVEAAISTHPLVVDCAVAGRPDTEWGQEVVAFIVAADHRGSPTTLLATIRDHVKQSLPAFCAPRRIVLVDSVPRTALGKVRRTELLAPPAAFRD